MVLRARILRILRIYRLHTFTPNHMIRETSGLMSTLTACVGLLAFSANLVGQGKVDRIEVPSVVGSKVFTNATVLSVTEQGVKIAHDAGVSLLAFEHLPEVWKGKYTPPKKQESPSSPATVAPPVQPAAPAQPGVSGAVVSSFDPQHLVFIKTDKGVGSGFIAKADKITYVYTNAHVLCGEPGSFATKIESITTAAGKKLALPVDLELSETFDPNAPNGLEDLARFEVVVEATSGLYEIGKADSVPELNKEVIAYGNSLGGSVITGLDGKIVGVGTDRIEIDCEIVPGNSGGPVVLGGTKTILGVSTYLTDGKRDIWAKGTTFEKVRRFAIRPEQVTKWRKMKYTSLMMALAELSAFDRDTLTLAAACFLNPTSNRGGFAAPSTKKGDYIVREVIVGGSGYRLGSVIASGIARVNQKLGSASATRSMATAVPIFQEFFATVTLESTNQSKSMKSSDRVPYLKQYIPAMLEMRRLVHDEFVSQGATRYR
ncbi:trypsin-like peptidase [Roseimicrobium gellanilyticum]|uniref:Trypsin-like peptidase n=1 Tax=Roseimicrobium gellanilyticum TaxID=748857 RepID=A0A366HU80_9BACT|nr:serine protease [Roseimicrobium gellanilyticum]RBP46493.1 trypsin-like peptidase [Roseimicrobium gellanilyticum]